MTGPEQHDGMVYLVGAGPGDPGLLTLGGQAALARAEIVIYDHLVNARLLEHAPETAERIYVGKESAAHTLDQGQINQLMIDRARGGAVVVRLKGGDPFVFGRGGEEALALAQAGVHFQVIPGVTAGIAAAAYAGIPVTHRGLAGAVALVTGHESAGGEASAIDYHSLARFDGTLVFYMAVANLEAICRGLIEGGLASDTPAAIVRWGTMPNQEVLVDRVGGIGAKARQAGIRPPAVLVVGKTVSLREKIKWFELRPLYGQRIVVTRSATARPELTDELERLGAEVIEVPAIRFEPPADTAALDEAIAELASFDWVIFTSANAVEWFFAAVDRNGLDARSLAGVRICAIGPATADRLRHFGLRCDAQPGRFLASAIVEMLAAQEKLTGLRILCPRSDVAPDDLVEALANRGAEVHPVIAYRTVPAAADTTKLLELLRDNRIDWLTFTSSSTAANFLTAIGEENLRGRKARVASIGPVTSETLRRLGFPPTVDAKVHTVWGLVAAIMEHQTSQGSS
jgi:uroporphyrinogen III methyltransferase/synthase